MDINLDVRQRTTERYAIYNDDNLRVSAGLPDDSVDLIVYSPPFAQKDGALYQYSSSERDLSNSRTYAEFMEHYEFMVEEFARLTKPGRMNCVHVMDVPLSNSGTNDYIWDFAGDVIRMHARCRNPDCTAPEWQRERGFCGHGWYGHTARHSIWKEPLAVRNRTMAKKLAHATVVDDSTNCGVAGADYLLVFKRTGDNEVPVTHPSGLQEYAGAKQMPSDLLKYRNWGGSQIENKFSHWIWRQYASSFWDDIRIDRVLPYQESKDPEDERHVHPLQLDIYERCLVLYSNPGEIIYEPFMGVGSGVWAAVENDRFGLGAELKRSYFRQALMNLEEVQVKAKTEQIRMF